MTREEFKNLSENRIIYLDGATGSNLVKAGLPSGVCPEEWILENPQVRAKSSVSPNSPSVSPGNPTMISVVSETDGMAVRRLAASRAYPSAP